MAGEQRRGRKEGYLFVFPIQTEHGIDTLNLELMQALAVGHSNGPGAAAQQDPRRQVAPNPTQPNSPDRRV